jgi:hypothetical protein
MRTLLSLFLILTAAAAPAATTPLREVFQPEDWTSQVDAVGNLLLANKDRSVNFSLSFVNTTSAPDALDPLAKVLLASAVNPPWDSRESVEISGHRGYKYTAHVRHTNGVEVHAEVALVAVGEKKIAACSLLLTTKVKATEETLARLVFAAVKLVPAP